MNPPEAQNDKLIELLIKKSEQFLPNIALYFERDELLIRKSNHPIKNSAKQSTHKDPAKLSPKFDAFNITPARNVRKGQVVNNWTFILSEYRAKNSKTFFISGRELEGLERAFWFIYLNGQFFLYYPDSGTIAICYSSGTMTIKGNVISFTNEDNQPHKFMAISNPTFQGFHNFITGAFSNTSKIPFEDFFKSFLAKVNYPKISAITISYYRYIFESSIMLYGFVHESCKTRTQNEKLAKAWISAVDTKIISLLKVWFFTYFKEHTITDAFDKKDVFLFTILRIIFMNDPEFAAFASKYKENHDPMPFTNISLTELVNYIIFIVFSSSIFQNMTETDRSMMTLKFIFEIILNDTEIRKHYQDTSLLVYFIDRYDVKPELNMRIQPSISEEECQAFLDEIVANVEYYIKHFTTTPFQQNIEDYNTFSNPSTLRSQQLFSTNVYRPRTDSALLLQRPPDSVLADAHIYDSFPIAGPQSLPVKKKPSTFTPLGDNSQTSNSDSGPQSAPVSASPFDSTPGSPIVPFGLATPPSLLTPQPKESKPVEISPIAHDNPPAPSSFDDFSIPPSIVPSEEDDKDDDGVVKIPSDSDSDKPVVDEKPKEKEPKEDEKPKETEKPKEKDEEKPKETEKPKEKDEEKPKETEKPKEKDEEKPKPKEEEKPKIKDEEKPKFSEIPKPKEEEKPKPKFVEEEKPIPKSPSKKVGFKLDNPQQQTPEKKKIEEKKKSSDDDSDDEFKLTLDDIKIDYSKQYPPQFYYRPNRKTSRPLLRGNLVKQCILDQKREEWEKERAEKRKRKEEEKKKKEEEEKKKKEEEEKKKKEEENKQKDDEEKEEIIKIAPHRNYDGTEEPPMESDNDSESDVTIQNA
ncbi:hypothetical protein TVAG_432740 [Trichomonas vaginalis G3]|uniref:Uncharacterized protein n=1 Tax=Trichomonas vaginalis (strain ATCC PRA-98 / G3) TaxID=412133 RepID=A2DIR5_TRIV3|nr:neurofilament triplet H protein family [Trichomonas vaginalis G3]EAY19678.1 hypothetical protein TVAG_432740 [Trichomonas vaginalis G3]KAI5521302.1 neurofilament triplet H protein family [Trichomonas vaginalis G3]|eukprot:XP_001580664.1 hypothetical protein [Trichomonas vaginalis G3]